MIRVGGPNFADFTHGGIEQHDANVVVIFPLPFGAKLPQRLALAQITSSSPP